jgi:hypothetical protein
MPAAIAAPTGAQINPTAAPISDTAATTPVSTRSAGVRLVSKTASPRENTSPNTGIE